MNAYLKTALIALAAVAVASRIAAARQIVFNTTA